MMKKILFLVALILALAGGPARAQKVSSMVNTPTLTSNSLFSAAYGGTVTKSISFGQLLEQVQTNLTGTFPDRSANLESLGTFTRKLDSSAQQLKICIVGDSYADAGVGVAYEMMQKLFAGRTLAGLGFNNTANKHMYALAGGAALVNAAPEDYSTNWFSGYFRVPLSATVTWADSGNGITSDKIGVFWIATPAGGTIDVQVSTAGGAFTSVGTVAGYTAGAPAYGYQAYTLASGAHRIRVASTSGENTILATENYLSTVPGGIISYFMDKGGISAVVMTNTPLAIRQGVFTSINPDLVIFHNLDEATSYDIYTNAAFADWFNNVTAPKLVLGLHFKGTDGDYGFIGTLQRNDALRNACLQNGWAFCDLMPDARSLTNQVQRGWMTVAADPTLTHLYGPVGGLGLAESVMRKTRINPGVSFALTNGLGSSDVSGKANLAGGNTFTGDQIFQAAYFGAGNLFLSSTGTLAGLNFTYRNDNSTFARLFAKNDAIYLTSSVWAGSGAKGLTLTNNFGKLALIADPIFNSPYGYPSLGLDRAPWWGIITNIQLKGASQFIAAGGAAWPAAPAAAGACAIVSSNGYPFMLLSTNGGGGVSSVWTGTNKIGW